MASTTYTVLVLVRDPWDFKGFVDGSSFEIIIASLFNQWHYFESLDSFVFGDKSTTFITLYRFTRSSIYSVFTVVSSFYWLNYILLTIFRDKKIFFLKIYILKNEF
ncbi:hypothetical protein NGRA_0923 [Nosema granulosis]|uniref:Uncharacterized protein n=1 Tax=Nosema granulosis TaxID=83296 RepID=A0A9P6KZN9_9MICR|nr:hypothetical protein NGRA_0923 [Nosema granulosis]